MYHTYITICRDATADGDEIELTLPINFNIGQPEPDVGIKSHYIDGWRIAMLTAAIHELKLTETEEAQIELQVNEINLYDFM